MRQGVSGVIRGLIGFGCVALCAGYVFLVSDKVEAARDSSNIEPRTTVLTGHDLTVFERRLHRASMNSPLANTCAKGSLLGGTEIHVATKVSPIGQSVTRNYPDFAEVNVEREAGTPKALVLESLKPTLWKVTGKPSVIILLGEAVVAEFPEGVPVFAPKFVEECADARWVATPDSLEKSLRRDLLAKLVADPHSQFANRAKQVSQGLFGQNFTSWAAQQTDRVIQF